MDSDSLNAVSGGDQTDDLLTRAVTEALAAGMPWAQIAAQLGVPLPALCDSAVVTDHDWQEAIVAYENARAARLNDQTLRRRSETENPRALLRPPAEPQDELSRKQPASVRRPQSP